MFYTFHALLPKKLLSSIMYYLSRVEIKPLKNIFIKLFMQITGARLDDYARKNVNDYKSLLDFFTRELDSNARSIPSLDNDINNIISPVDGTVAHVGKLLDNEIYQIKGHHYSLTDLVGSEYAKDYINGLATTIYLAPYNYHRIHMPISGTLVRAKYIPGELNSVSISLLKQISALFARNERVVCEFVNGTNKFLMVLVGAVNVGSIETVMHKQITPNNYDFPFDLETNNEYLEIGAELGRFNLGSTIIFISQENSLIWENIKDGQTLELGNIIAKLNHDQ